MNSKIYNGLIFGTGVSSSKNEKELSKLVNTAIENGITGFDTAPSYKTEGMLGDIIESLIRAGTVSREDLHLQTKIDAWQMENGNIEGFVDEALKKLKTEYVDAILIHWPLTGYFDSTLEKLFSIKESGKIKYVGVCNLRRRHINRLVERNMIPDIIQIERNPLRTCWREKEACENTDISLQAYGALCKMDERIRDNQMLKALSEKYNKNVGQIVLKWHLQTGFAPVFTTTKESRIREYAELHNFTLTDDEIKEISSMNIDYKIYLESCICPGF